MNFVSFHLPLFFITPPPPPLITSKVLYVLGQIVNRCFRATYARRCEVINITIHVLMYCMKIVSHHNIFLKKFIIYCPLYMYIYVHTRYIHMGTSHHQTSIYLYNKEK